MKEEENMMLIEVPFVLEKDEIIPFAMRYIKEIILGEKEISKEFHNEYSNMLTKDHIDVALFMDKFIMRWRDHMAIIDAKLDNVQQRFQGYSKLTSKSPPTE